MFGTKVEFSGLADGVDLLLVEPNPRGGLKSSWKISNEYRPILMIYYLESSFTGIWERIMREE